MTDEELAREQWQVIQEELRRAEQQQWRDASPLPPMEKVILNWVAPWACVPGRLSEALVTPTAE